RLVPDDPFPTGSLQFHPDRSYLVTGGLGGIGREVARWLVSRGARHVVLTTRGGPNDASHRAAPGGRGRAGSGPVELECLGAKGECVAADVADLDAMTRLFGTIEPPLAGVFHVAGVPGWSALNALKNEELHAVLRPKADGAAVLHQLTADRELDHFVLFSSI